MPETLIRPLNADEPTLAALSALIIETVANGGSVSFMHPLAPEAARSFGWARCRRRRAENASCWARSSTAFSWAL